jgi:choloylglycine hydrolase
MCTAISYSANGHYFGRNLDLEYRYNEAVTINPRNFPMAYRMNRICNSHYATIGMATVIDGYPLYYDATNEHGLSMAGLNFPGNAIYLPPTDNMFNITPFEFIPWILGQCKTVSQAKMILNKTNLINIPFSDLLPLTDLHWMISDKIESAVIEPMQNGLIIHENPVGVLTNNPPFEFHMFHLSDYLNLTNTEPENRFSEKINLKPYSRGMGAIGLPGDLSSASRFIRAAFTKLNSICDNTEESEISQFFHILGSVAQQKGCVKVNDSFEKTVYTSCCNTAKGIYYYTTYENSQITGVHLFKEDLDGTHLSLFPMIVDQHIRFEN